MNQTRSRSEFTTLGKNVLNVGLLKCLFRKKILIFKGRVFAMSNEYSNMETDKGRT